MRLGSSHLTYCTNIHPGESWTEIRANLERYLPRSSAESARMRHSAWDCVCRPRRPGRWLRPTPLPSSRLSARERSVRLHHQRFSVREVPRHAGEGKGLSAGLGRSKPARVHEPAGRPAGGIVAVRRRRGRAASARCLARSSRTPATPEAIARIVDLLIRHVAHLVKVERDTGRTIALALEPEPCCLLETIGETVAFFGEHLYSKRAARALLACRTRAARSRTRAAPPSRRMSRPVSRRGRIRGSGGVRGCARGRGHPDCARCR